MWVQKAKLIDSDWTIGDAFGGSVSLVGETALLGAYKDDDAGLDSGSAYVFKKEGSVWVQSAKLTASDGAAKDSFGISVALAGDTAVAGTNAYSGTNPGYAYVFRLAPCLSDPDPGLAAATSTIIVTNADSGDLVGLGLAVALGSTSVGGICPGLGIELANPVLAGTKITDAFGIAKFSGYVPASLVGVTLYFQALDVSACEVTNLVAHTFL